MAKLTKKQKRQLEKIAVAHWKPIAVIVIMLAVLFVVAYFMGWIDLILAKFQKPEEPMLNTAGGYSTPVKTLNDLKINFIDVGQGDCIIIQLPDGKNMIIDSGDNNAAKDSIEDFIEIENITTFDYVLLTHQDKDHSANMDWIIDTYTCKYIFRPNSTHSKAANLPAEFNTGFEDPKRQPTATYANFMLSAYNEVTNNGAIIEIFNKDSDFSNEIVYNGETYTYSFNFLTPTASRNEIKYDDYNDYSPIMMLEYAGKRVLFTGDAEKENIEEYVETYGNQYNIDVLKMGHHGSRTSTTPALLQAIDPEYAVIQCGIGNDYDHPHPEPLQYLKNYDSNIELYRNDIHGDVILTIDVDGNIEFEQEKVNIDHVWTDGLTLEGILNSQEGQSLNFSIDIMHISYFDNSKKYVA